ncbi:MAG: hypothetical protein V7752_20725 [Halopseudomonas sp.]
MNNINRRYTLTPRPEPLSKKYNVLEKSKCRKREVFDLKIEYSEGEKGLGFRVEYESISRRGIFGNRVFFHSSITNPNPSESSGVPAGYYPLEVDGFDAPTASLGTGTGSFLWRIIFDNLVPSIQSKVYLKGTVLTGGETELRSEFWKKLTGSPAPCGQKFCSPLRQVSIERFNNFWTFEEIDLEQ